MSDDDKELKDQRVVTMMTPSELEIIDDWMFKNRIRSRGEAIRRLCQVGLSADEHFRALADSYIGAARAAMDVAAKTKSDAEAMAVLRHVADFGQRFGKMRGAILSMRQNETFELALAELNEIMQAYAAQDPARALDLMRAYIERVREMPDV